jgi:hypothetical protein
VKLLFAPILYCIKPEIILHYIDTLFG